MSDPEEAPGWRAIDAVFERLYPGQEPKHFVGDLSRFFGGERPIQGISVYEATRGRPHWHFVTYGFSDLYEKQDDEDPDSGFGFELTFRLARGDEAQPPAWPINLLQNLGRYVFKSGNGFAAGHYLDANGPIALDTGTSLVAILFAEDDEAGTIDTPNGRVAFVQMVGATRDEFEAAQRWRTSGLVEMLREADPALVSDLTRGSVLERPGARDAIEAGLAKDGSTCGLIYLDVVEVAETPLRLTLGARGVLQLLALLPYRLPFGRELALLGDKVATFVPGANGVSHTEHGVKIGLDEAGAAELSRVLRPKAGTYRLDACPDLEIEVLPSETRDADGKVIDVIG